MERFELSQDLGSDILSKAKAKGATQGDVVMAESESFFVTVRMGEVEKISQAGEKRLGLRLFSAIAPLRLPRPTFRSGRLKNSSITRREWPRSPHRIRTADCPIDPRLRVRCQTWT